MSVRGRVFAVARGTLFALALVATLYVVSLVGRRAPWLSTAATLLVVLCFVLLLVLGRRDGGFIVTEQD